MRRVFAGGRGQALTLLSLHKMKISRSSRHPKIAGDFGEALVLYWLSKSGFECSCVDHTGIDLIARNPDTNELMGISVKSRTKSAGKEKERVKIPSDDFRKIEAACQSFGCQPYIAVVVDADSVIRVFLTSMSHVLALCPSTDAGSGWRMSDEHLEMYSSDHEIRTFELHTKKEKWREEDAIQT